MRIYECDDDPLLVVFISATNIDINIRVQPSTLPALRKVERKRKKKFLVDINYVPYRVENITFPSPANDLIFGF